VTAPPKPPIPPDPAVPLVAVVIPPAPPTPIVALLLAVSPLLELGPAPVGFVPPHDARSIVTRQDESTQAEAFPETFNRSRRAMMAPPSALFVHRGAPEPTLVTAYFGTLTTRSFFGSVQ
jgi:hypothetical protein